MKTSALKPRHLVLTSTGSLVTAALLALVTTQTPLAGEESAAKDAVEPPEPPVSTFNFPQTLNDGRDPFFPTSTRVIAMFRPSPITNDGPAELELKGISGAGEQRLAIINNRTLAVGEEQNVTTPQGRVKVLLLAIEGTKVRIKAQGQTRELLLRKGI